MDLLIRTKIFSTADKGLSSNFQEACFHNYGYTIKNNFVLDNVYREDNDIDIIIKAIKDNPKITKSEIAKIIGKSTRTVQRIINENTKIKFIGSSKTGHREILSDDLNKNNN